MAKTTVRGVLRCSDTQPGAKVWAGYVSNEEQVDEACLTVVEVEVFDPEDNSGDRWVLAHPTALTLLSTQDLETIEAEDMARRAKAKLTDEELASLGLTR